jgi:hypothetical protein
MLIYLPFSGLVGAQKGVSTNYIVEQCAIDLKFLIESYAYMPFTRNVTITLNGDRRFKYGTWIRIESTGEIGYVTQVQNSINIGSNIDRTTTVTLSRVMVEKYCNPHTDKDVSYFNIINTELIYEYIVASLNQANIETQRLGVQIRQNFAVNKEIFDFFVKRKQFN